jgi:signal transduction histidine kinase
VTGVDEPLERVAAERSHEILNQAAAAAKDLLGLDVAMVTAFEDGRQVYVAVEGDGLGVRPGGAVLLGETVCQRVVLGRAPEVIPDLGAEPSVADLGVVGERGICSYVGVPLRFSDGRVYGTLCALGEEQAKHLQGRDLEFLHVIARLVADYLEREEALGLAEQARADTFARVTHDLRSPLQAIAGFAELIERTQDIGYARTIRDAAKRLGTLLDELLESQALERQSAKGPVDLAELAAEQIDVFRGQSSRHELVLEAPEPVVVVADRIRAGGVLANLLSNALKYSPAGGQVTVTVATEDGRGRVAVADQGLGIPEEQAQAIFTRFFRVSTPETKAIPRDWPRAGARPRRHSGPGRRDGIRERRGTRLHLLVRAPAGRLSTLMAASSGPSRFGSSSTKGDPCVDESRLRLRPSPPWSRSLWAERPSPTRVRETTAPS